MSLWKKIGKIAGSVIKVSLPAIGFAIGGPVGGAIGGVAGALVGGLVGGGGGGGSAGSGGGGSSGGGILGEIMRYGKMIQDLVESPIKAALGQIKAGAWQGEDADAFVGEMERDLLPRVAELVSSIFGISINVTRAVTNIVDADKKALTSAVSPALDVFKF